MNGAARICKAKSKTKSAYSKKTGKRAEIILLIRLIFPFKRGTIKKDGVNRTYKPWIGADRSEKNHLEIHTCNAYLHAAFVRRAGACLRELFPSHGNGIFL